MIIKTTYVTVKSFMNFVNKITPETLKTKLTIDITDINQVERWIKEHCQDLTYKECKEKFIEMELRGLTEKSKEEAEAEYFNYVMMDVQNYLGTTLVSEAFKKVYEKYKDMILSVNVDETNINDMPELETLFEYVRLKYKCEDVTVLSLRDLYSYGMIETYQGTAEQYFNDLMSVFNIRPANNILELVFTVNTERNIQEPFTDLFLVYKKDTKPIFLVCYYTGYLDVLIKFMLLTHSEKDPVIISKVKFNKSGRILSGIGALLY